MIKFRHPISTLHFKWQLLFFSTTNLLARATCYPSPRLKSSSFGEVRHPEAIICPTRLCFSKSARTQCASALKLCAKLGSLDGGQQLHSSLLKLGLYNVLSLKNQLLHVYVKCEEVDYACKLFDEMIVRNVVTWNTLINGIANCRRSLRLGLDYFRRMLREIVNPDHVTFASLFRISLELNDAQTGKQLHCFVVKLGLSQDCFVCSAMVDMFAKSGLVKDARCVFDDVSERDLVLWNVMMSCYSMNCLGEETFGVFMLMGLMGIKGDDFTFTSLLNSCASLGYGELGRQAHGLIIRMCFDLDVVVASSLVDMYAKNENIIDARKAFYCCVFKNVITWITMIVGYGKSGDGKEAFKLFQEMLREDFIPDELALASIFSSCGNLVLAGEIEQTHAYVIKKGSAGFLSVANAMINAYSKSGSISRALLSFSSIAEPDLISWTSVIAAYAFHGLSKEAIEHFEKMLSSGVKPDQIAFLAVLSACSHGGLVSEGLHYFTLMNDFYKIMPVSEHYTCLTDLFSRVGLLNEALNVLIATPVLFDSEDALGAFVGACELHGKVELAKWAAEKLFQLEPNKTVNYTLISNMYASIGHWSDVVSIRKLMKARCSHKVPGSSCINQTT